MTRSRRSSSGVVAVAALLALAGCPGGVGTDPAAATLVVGIQSEDLGPGVETLNIVARVDGAEVSKDSLNLRGPGASVFPREVKLASAHGAGSAEIEITGVANGGDVLLSRLAKAPFVPGQSRLLRVRLESRCVDPRLRAAGPLPMCAAPQTCINGGCADSSVATGDLETYRADWAENPPDICKPAGAGAPQVVVGTGQTDYGTLKDNQTLQVELGPQGGHHVWIAARMKNLRQSGSTTTLSAVQPGTGLTVPPTAFVFTFDRDEGGYCKLYGLRFQLDSGAANLGEDYKRFLGKPLDVTVEVKDASGLTAKGSVHIQIADTILCPSGVGTCT